MNLCKLILLVITLFSLFQFSFAHVEYVVTEDERERFAGVHFDFLLRALKNPFNVLLIFLTIAFVLLIYFLLKRSKLFMNYVARVEEKTESYYELISWMLRLGFGIAFIGGGVAKV
jgi:predicted membrane protein